jgi:hypothetical protein
MSVTTTVSLGAFAREALAGDGTNGSEFASSSVARAIRCYLNDRKSRIAGWSYPSFLREQSASEEVVELELSVDDALWLQLEEEAEQQEVSPRQMLEHAVFYFAAEVNAGRVTERILDDLDED